MYWEYRKLHGKHVSYVSFADDWVLNRDARHWWLHEGLEIVARTGIKPSADGLRIYGMAKARDYKSVEFLRFRLTAEDEPMYRSWWDKEQDNLPQMLSSLIESGYKLSITPDFENACTIFTIIGKDCVPENVGKAFSSRADGWHEAAGLTMYKHYVLAGGGAWPDDSRIDNWG